MLLGRFSGSSVQDHLLQATEVYEGDRFTYGEALEIAVALSRTLAQKFGVERGLGVWGKLMEAD